MKYKMHTGEIVRIDLREEIRYISTLISESNLPMLNTCYEEGYYLPGSDVPSIPLNKGYYSFNNKTKEKRTVTNLKGIIGDVYNQNGEFVLFQGDVCKLRPYPDDNIRINQCIIRYYTDTIDMSRAYLKDYRPDVLENLILKPIVANWYSYMDDEDPKSYLMVEEVMNRIVDVLDVYSNLISKIGFENPWAIFTFTIKHGFLFVKNEIDWRVSEYYRLTGVEQDDVMDE